MAKFYKVNNEAILSSEIWPEATRDELRVLTYVIAMGGDVHSKKALSEACGITVARAKSSLSLWEEAGVLTECKKDEIASIPTVPDPKVEYEFEEGLERGAVDNERSLDIADSIRNGELKEVLDMIASLLERPNLNTQEIKNVTSLYSQLGLSGNFILTLAQHLDGKNKLTTKRLQDEASRLVEKGIDNTEALERYIDAASRYSGVEYEFRNIIKAHSRSLSKTEKACLKLWTEDYGYDIAVIDEAFDIAVQNTGKASMPYMKKLIEVWHTAGCKTVDDVIAYREKEAMQRATPQSAKEEKPTKKKKTASEPEYASFNSDDALMRALQRSYGEGSNENK